MTANQQEDLERIQVGSDQKAVLEQDRRTDEDVDSTAVF